MIKITKTFIARLRKSPLDILKTLTEDEIASIVQYANHSYYNTHTPAFSDNLFDMIKDYLENLNSKHPILKHIGSTAESGKKEELPYFMGSLDKIKSDEKAVEKFKKDYPDSYMVSDKLDGNSALIYYTNGEMKLYSRGDGTVGQNISHLVPFVRNIVQLKQNKEITLRGELIISRNDFEKVKDKGANARNMVAGLINSKVPDLEIAKLTQFVAYELISPKLDPENQYRYMHSLGFKVAYNDKVSQSNLTIDELSSILLKRRERSEFEIDGIVIFHNKVHKRVKDNPPYAFAFKSVLTMQKAEVIVSNVEWNMSKDGYLIPVVNFNPVALAGVTIRRAHGFNGKFINDNKIGPGSKIIIMRSGDVIPYITEILSQSETGEPQMPEVKYSWTKTGVDIMMDVSVQKDSDELKLKNLINFFDKIDVKGLSEGNIRKMYASGLKTVKQIFSASKEDLLKVDGFKSKMVENIAFSIQEKKKCLDCVLVMNASNMLGRGIGRRKIELIVSSIPSILTSRYMPSLSELQSLKGIEKTTADLFRSNLPRYFDFVDENDIQCMFDVLQTGEPSSDYVIPLEASKNIDKDGLISYSPKSYNFNGLKVVFTGFRNDILEQMIKSNGGNVSTSVSKSTTHVIRKDENDKESSKVKKADELGVTVVNLSDFIKEHNIKF